MPGHKGVGEYGESLDVTEISGADSLYEARGIIKESESNASLLFGCPTLYSTEGSSQCIRAIVHLISLYARERGLRPRICAARNVHRSFISACALSDIDVTWLYGSDGGYLSFSPDISELEAVLSGENKPAALYLTSPDYLGSVCPIKEIAELCHKNGVLLAVDNAHGAYLKFMPEDSHPITLGADICCDSAHKTLPVLTGGAYLHVSDNAPTFFRRCARDAMALFGSTSPSYLILQSLDRCNTYLEGLKDSLKELVPRLEALKDELVAHGYTLVGNEALKITVSAKPFGYTGVDLAKTLESKGLMTEFSDPDYTVLMLTDKNLPDLYKIRNILLSIDKKAPIVSPMPSSARSERVMSIREAVTSPYEETEVSKSVGRICAALSVSCPPAVPIAVSGEVITENTVKALEYYGVKTVSVVKSE
jgi:arginine/lysine/ornithine decarboxylase